MRLGNIPSEADVDNRLHQAAELGDLAAAKALLSQACAINVIDICGRTPLHFAAANNQLEMVEYLVSAGADVNGQADGEGWQDHAPLGHAVETCSTDRSNSCIPQHHSSDLLRSALAPSIPLVRLQPMAAQNLCKFKAR